MKRALIGALVLLLGTGSWAQVTITFNATMNQAGLGFAENDPISLVFTLNDAVTPDTNSASWRLQWTEQSGGPAIYSAVTGTGLTGNLLPPVGSTISVLEIQSSYMLLQMAYGTTGLQINGVDINSIRAEAVGISTTFDLSGYASTPTPSDYLSAYAGDYSVSSTGGSTAFNTAQGTFYYTITSMTISAVPEPSSYAAMAGLLVLGLVMWRRYRVSKTA